MKALALRVCSQLLLAMLLMQVQAGAVEPVDPQVRAELVRQISIASGIQSTPEPIPPRMPGTRHRLRPIDDVDLAPALSRELPERDFAAELFDAESSDTEQTFGFRLWGESSFAWAPPAICHRPLYFADNNLERHGRSYGLFQPAASIAHASSRFVALPGLLVACPPRQCNYTLGQALPGSRTPYYVYRPALSPEGCRSGQGKPARK